jgi:hypothetical protein
VAGAESRDAGALGQKVIAGAIALDRTMTNVAFDAWVQRARGVRIEAELERRGVQLRGKTEREGPCPRCGGDNRFSINVKKQLWNCRHCKTEEIDGDVIGLVRHLDGVDFIAACTTLAGEPPPKANGKANGKANRKDTSKKVVVAEFEYHDETGGVAFAVERIQFRKLDGSYVLKNGKPDKVFSQRRPDPDRAGAWLWNVDGVPVLPYRLPELTEAIAGEHTIFVVEGEAKADVLWSWNVPATCCAGGSKKWKPAHSGYLRGADVVILPDADEVGRKHADTVAASLQGVAASVRVLELPDLPATGDIIDWAKQGGTVERFHELASAAVDYAVWKDAADGALYRADELAADIAAGRTILIIGSAQEVDALRLKDIPATCNSGDWQKRFNEIFRGADVVFVPKANEEWRRINEIGANLNGVAARLRVLVLPKTQGEWGVTADQLTALIEVAPDWQAPPDVNADGRADATASENELLATLEPVITRLSQMRPGIEREREHQRLRNQLGVNRAALDAEIDHLAAKHTVEALHGHWIVPPHPEPVEGDSLLRDLIRRYRSHVVFTDHDALTVALWDLASWVHDDAAVHSPILCVTSPEPDSGKSTCLGVTSFLIPRAITSVDVTDSALFRSIQRWQPSFVIDEFDDVLADDTKRSLRSVINSGHTKGTGIIRCGDREQGYLPEVFRTFAPKTIGMIGTKLPPATLSRCVIIEMRRKSESDVVSRFLHEDDAGLASLRSRCLRWSQDNVETLHAAVRRNPGPAMPKRFKNRLADNWRLMFAIADLCGEDWGQRAREAAEALTKEAVTIGVLLLADIRSIFRDAGDPVCMLSSELIAKLKENPEAPWATYGRGQNGITPIGLANLLGGGGGRGRRGRGGFGIQSKTVHPPGQSHGRGYARDQFVDAWAAYLPADDDEDADNVSRGGE